MGDEVLGAQSTRPQPDSSAVSEGGASALSLEERSPLRERSHGTIVRFGDGAPVPIDHEERLRLRRELDRTFFVEAGAGTGKTTELVARIVSLVAEGQLCVEKLAAITFTEAAAAELRERVRRGLEKAASEAPDEVKRERCSRAAREVDLATIQTIHAFAGTLLRTFSIEAGLPPGFEVWDPIQSDLAFDERFRSWLYDEVPSDDPDNRSRRAVIRRALLLGMTFDQLRALAKGLQDQADLLDRATTWPAPHPEDPRSVAQRWGSEIQELRELLPLAKNPETDLLAQHVRDLQVAATRMVNATDENGALVALQAIDIKVTHGNQRDWRSDASGVNACQRIKSCLRSAQAEIERVLEEHRTAVFVALLGYLRDFTLDFADQRRQRGVATFHDLLTWARDLLRDNPDVRAQAQRRFDRIFVDEFQDTDPLQAEIVWFLAADPNQRDARDWRDLQLVPGKLFVVGDPKQSIYRFRRADIGLYTRIYEQAVAEERAGLVQNFRSLPPVLRWVNYHFRQHMRYESGVQVAYVDLQPSDPPVDLNGARWGVYRVGDRIDGKAADVRATEADIVASIARQIVADGWLVRDENGGLRRARNRDICVLMPRRSNLRGLEDAFARLGVPYRMESGSLVLATQEVRDLLSCLRAIEDPSDQVALVAALRSPAFGCSDVDLLRWVEAGGKLDYEEPGTGPDGPVADAFASLHRFHATRASRSPAATIEAFLRERMLAVQAFGQPRPREAWRRLRYILSQARLFNGTGRTTLRAFVDWIEGLQRIQVNDTETPLPEADEDAVRFLTIHGAKGLEFPIVILTGLGTPPGSNHSTISVLADRHTGTLQVRCGAFETEGYKAAKDREKAMDAAERVRLLYVATTRARDHLVLCLCRGRGPCDAAHIAETLDTCGEPLCHALELDRARNDGPAEHERIVDPGSLSPDEHALEERQWLEARQLLIDRLGTAPLVTATDLASRDSAQQLDSRSAPEVVGEDWQPTISPEPEDAIATIDSDPAIRIGQAVHASLVQITTRSTPMPAEIVEAATRRFGVVEHADEVRRLVEAIQTSPIVQEAVASGRAWHEVPVGVEADGVLLEGRIDLLFERSDGSLAIVDFKTDRIDPAHLATRAASYRLQGGAYALAVERITGRSVSIVGFVFASLGGHVVIYHDVPALTATVRETLRQYVRSDRYSVR